jgi:hypothetical protein
VILTGGDLHHSREHDAFRITGCARGKHNDRVESALRGAVTELSVPVRPPAADRAVTQQRTRVLETGDDLWRDLTTT